jgi:D-ribose pyranose/furanose isomerase RbsD
MNFTIEDLKKKNNPNGKPYIDGMTKHVENLIQVYAIIKELEVENITLRNQNANYHIQVMKQLHEMDQLREANKNLIEGL